MDAQSEERVGHLARKLGAAVEEVFVCRRSLPTPFDPARDQVMISVPAGLWSGLEQQFGSSLPPVRQLVGRLFAWNDVGMLSVQTFTGYSVDSNRIVTEVEMEIPSLAEGSIGMRVQYQDDPAHSGDERTLAFIQSCLRRAKSIGLPS